MTFRSVLEDLHGQLADSQGRPVSSLSRLGVNVVYTVEPTNGQASGPYWVTMRGVGVDENFYEIELRVYAALSASPGSIQFGVWDVVDAINALVSTRYGGERWTAEVDSELGWMCAVNVLQVGR
jgi:hypothetical protein